MVFKNPREELIRTVADFAKTHIKSRDDLHRLDTFPTDIWQKMGKYGLMGAGLPVPFKSIDISTGSDCTDICTAGYALARYGANMGIVLSWLIHQITARFLIFKFGNDSQKKNFLDDLSSGRITASFAVSEPDAGSHPKHLKTSAVRQNDDFIINGRKTLLTNGPIADIFIVIAQTGMEPPETDRDVVIAPKKLFSAFIVSRNENINGLKIGHSLELNFLRPSVHGGISLTDCLVSSKNILGTPDRAYREMVIPFREIEDALLAGPVAGIIQCQLSMIASMIASMIREKSPAGSSSRKLHKRLGRLQSIAHTAKILAFECAKMLEDTEKGLIHQEFTSLLIFYKDLVPEFQEIIESTISEFNIPENEKLKQMSNDLSKLSAMSKNITAIKQSIIGERLVYRK
ncbi:acyl-CoA dehydrogenase family protein [Desulfobacterales bacterium HSG16]|nr:acyl-CoA dehydrogenase family protein [Desulfobacterales bacterium HSG16]